MDPFRLPLIYNLFPRLVGTSDQWVPHASRAAQMGFNWIYLNPINYPGFSGSLYSTKVYEWLNPLFDPHHNPFPPLSVVKPVVQQMQALGLRPMIDLVINHVAVDSPLIQEHPAWFVWNSDGNVQNPFAVDPDNPSKKTVWGDLAMVDNRHSPDREGLWQFWTSLVLRYMDLGFEGFRCDAAYQVPAELWAHLIHQAQRVNPAVLFWAENLGCTTEQTQALRGAGFNFFCNSSKWWNFQDSWCLDQHEAFEDLPSISFPETHDTERLAHETNGLETIQRQRYAFAATFSAGVMMPIGYEFGFRKKLDVVNTQPSDWETPTMELQSFIRAVNEWKCHTPVLQGEGTLKVVSPYHPSVLVLSRESDFAPGKKGWIIVNRDWNKTVEFSLSEEMRHKKTFTLVDLTMPETRPKRSFASDTLTLEPATVLFLF